MISFVLLLPRAESRARLLAPGCMVAFRAGDVWHFGWTVDCDGDRVGVYWPDLGAEPLVPDETHLVLARNGAVVVEGADRLGHVSAPVRTMVERLVTVLLGRDEWGIPLDYARHLLSLEGALTLLDSGEEVSGE